MLSVASCSSLKALLEADVSWPLRSLSGHKLMNTILYVPLLFCHNNFRLKLSPTAVMALTAYGPRATRLSWSRKIIELICWFQVGESFRGEDQTWLSQECGFRLLGLRFGLYGRCLRKPQNPRLFFYYGQLSCLPL